MSNIFFGTQINYAQQPLIERASAKCLWAPRYLCHAREVQIVNEKVIRETRIDSNRSFAKTLLAIVFLLPGTIIGTALELLATLSSKVRKYRHLVAEYDQQKISKTAHVGSPIVPQSNNPAAHVGSPVTVQQIDPKNDPALQLAARFPQCDTNCFIDAHGKVRDLLNADGLKRLVESLQSSQGTGRIGISGQSIARNTQGQEDLRGVEALSKFLAARSETLYLLDLTSTGLTDKALSIVAQGMSQNGTLHGVWLSHNPLTLQGIQNLLSQIDKPNYTRLKLDGIALGDAGAKILSPWLAKRSCHEFSLNGCSIQANGYIELAKALEETFSPLKDSPSNVCKGLRITLNENQCGDQGAAAIAALIRKGGVSNSVHIELNHNGITYKGFKLLVEALADLGSLPRLSGRGITIELKNNSISLPVDEGETKALMALLEKCHWSDFISLNGNPALPSTPLWKQADIRSLNKIRFY